MPDRITAIVVGQGPGVAGLINIIVKWTVSGGEPSGEVAFPLDLEQPIGLARQDLRDQVAAYVSDQTSIPFTSVDVIGIDDLIVQLYGVVPISVSFSALIASDDLHRVIVPSILNHPTVQIDSAEWSISARALLSGTATFTLRNGANTLLASKAITAAGTYTFTPTVSTIAAGDVLRFGFSGVGLGLSDVAVTGWLKIPLGV